MAKGAAQVSQTKAALRRQDAVRLRARGVSFRDIQRDLGYATLEGVKRDIRTELREGHREELSDVLTLEIIRLDNLYETVMDAADGGDWEAARVALAIHKQRADYLGLAEIGKEAGDSAVDNWINGVIGEDDEDLDADEILGVDETPELSDIDLELELEE